MNPRQSKRNRENSNFSGRSHDESPNQWTAYGRSDSDRNDRGSYRADQTNWTNSNRGRSFEEPRDYDNSRDVRTRDSSRDSLRDNNYRGFSDGQYNQDRYAQQMNPYPHSYSEYDSRRDMESRRFGAHEGNSYINDRSHPESQDSRELYRPSFDDSSRAASSFSGGGYSSQNPSQQWGSSMNGADRNDRSYGGRDSRSSETSFSGRGPKGFKRSDERIKEEVCEMLTRDHSINAEDIDVEVSEGEVTLTGSVPDRRMKHLAEDCVERALGVKDVINNIRVKRESSTSFDTDSESSKDERTSSGKKSTGSTGSSTVKSNH